MATKEEVAEIIRDQGILPLYYADDAETSIGIMRALYAAGIRTTEYADRGAHALSNFRQMHRVCEAELPGMALGIGTIKNAATAQAYIDEGATFIVCPGVMEDVTKVAQRNNLLCLPGCMTPSEIIRAETAEARIVKLFPANNLGPEYVQAIAALFPEISFLPTGGIILEEDNLRSWFKSGICAVGGSKMITSEIIDNKLFDQLATDARAALEMIKTIKDT